MGSFSTFVLAVACAGVPLGLAADQRDAGVVLRAVRFYRADQDRTRVKGLVQIPLSFLQPAGQGGQATYNVAVRVADSTGLAL
jgi:hypothetical protein